VFGSDAEDDRSTATGACGLPARTDAIAADDEDPAERAK
jgi:hypothetical protein